MKDRMKDYGKGDSEMNDSSSDISREGFKKTSFLWLQCKRVSSNLRL